MLIASSGIEGEVLNVVCVCVLVARAQVTPLVYDIIVLPLGGCVPAIGELCINVEKRAAALRLEEGLYHLLEQGSGFFTARPAVPALLKVRRKRLGETGEIGLENVGVIGKGDAVISERGHNVCLPLLRPPENDASAGW